MAVNSVRKENIDKLVKESSEIVQNFFGKKFGFPVHVVFNTRGVILSGLLPWAVSGIRKSIVIKYPQAGKTELSHEMCHWALKKLAGGHAVPLWFDEGLACHVSGYGFVSAAQELRTLIRQRRTPKLLGWRGLSGKLRWVFEMYASGNTKLIYGISYFMVKNLLAKKGSGKVINFIRMLKTEDFENAFISVFKINTAVYFEEFVTNFKR